MSQERRYVVGIDFDVRLHDYFGRDENNVMKTLKLIRDQAKILILR